MIGPQRTTKAIADGLGPEATNLIQALYLLQDNKGEDADHDKKAEWKFRRFQWIAKNCCPDATLLRKVAERRAALVPSPDGKVLKLKIVKDSSLTVGMSTSTLLENGMALLRPWGIPVIAGSSIKGTISSWLSEILIGVLNPTSKERVRILHSSGLWELFGESRKENGADVGFPGRVNFLDALPLNMTLAVDVTTPHYQSWYQKLVAPLGCENPIPVSFLCLQSGSTFQFAYVVEKGTALPDLTAYDTTLSGMDIVERQNPVLFIDQLIRSTAKWHGFGSQTAAGYGRMEKVE